MKFDSLPVMSSIVKQEEEEEEPVQGGYFEEKFKMLNNPYKNNFSCEFLPPRIPDSSDVIVAMKHCFFFKKKSNQLQTEKKKQVFFNIWG